MGHLDSSKSDALFERASRVIPGGVDSPVRAFRAVGRSPLFITSAAGSNISDIDGNTFTDYVGSWGPMILGHGHPAVLEAVCKAAERGTSFGAPTLLEVELAEEVITAFPSIQLVRFVSSGTEATMSALRLARGFTGRDRIVKFEGCYHGHTDALLVKAGSGLATQGTPDSAGISASLARSTIVIPYNDVDAVQRVFAEHPDQIAALIVEPVAGNMGCVAPAPGFLEALRELTRKNSALLIFDEVITGFRVAYGGAQQLYGIQPDLTCLGKIIGGGLPVGAFGGRADVMRMLAPLGPVYQAGTLSGNPLAMTAGLTTVKLLKELNPYPKLEEQGRRLQEALTRAGSESGVPVTVNRVGSILTGFFCSGPVVSWQSANKADTGLYARFFRGMLEQSIYLAPSQFECAFIGIAHTEEVIDKTAEAARKVLRAIVSG